ncbi:hypothetical protein MC378_04670 [Polaribacter sp. MSW13]|uniref:Uncharacterized protein n=1 Tax=Polaribacter marinus TaxID=2916838 RepID=A0A9X1VS08_9FLAO|nr:hypothetical protein [Polaribacter marinus]MCI2228451.1 hypothetical protein [Polaribacter marinus]
MEKIKFSNRPTMQVLRKGFKLKQNKAKIEKGINPFEIKNNTSSKVRLELNWDDILNERLVEMEIVDEVFFNGKKVYLFRKPYFIPKFSQYYACKIESPDNYYLVELIEMLLFLNPNPDHLMRKKITECILQKFTLHIKKESQVKIGHYAFEPVLDYEEVLGMVNTMGNLKNNKSFISPHEETIMYGEVYFTKGEKISLRTCLRNENASKYYESAIYTAIQVLIKSNSDVKINLARLHEQKKIIKFNSEIYASAKLISNVISEANKLIIKNHNKVAIFNSQNQKEKYNIFLSLDNPTLDCIVSYCKVSKRDASKFKRIKKNQAHNV